MMRRLSNIIAAVTFAVLVIITLTIIQKSASVISAPITPSPVSNEVAIPATGSNNAADSYREAVKLLDAIPVDKLRQLDRYESHRLDAQAATFFEQEAQIVDWVRRGAESSTCDWGENDITARGQEVSELYGVCSFMLAHAYYSIEQRDTATALDDVMADIALSHHIGANHWIIDKLVEIGSEHRAITFLAASLPSFSPEQLKSLPQRLDSLPPPTTGAQIMQGEYDQMVKRSKEEGLAVQIIVSGMQGFFKDMGDSMELPPEEFAKAVDSQVNQLKLNPMAGGLGSSLKAIQVQMAMLRAERAMLRTAIDITLEGPAVANNSHDLFGNGPFQYFKTEKGFNLTSQLKVKGQFVVLPVGIR